MLSGFKFFLTCAFELVALMAPPLPWAAVLTVLAVISFIWGMTDLIKGIRITDINQTAGIAPTAFDQRVKWGAVAFLGLLFAIAAGGGLTAKVYYEKYKAKERDVIYIEDRFTNLPEVSFKIRGYLLQEYYGEFTRTLMFCRHKNDSINYLDDTRIEKSAVFDIPKDYFYLKIILTPDFLNSFPIGFNLLDCHLAVMKEGLDVSGIKSLRQFQAMGGVLAQKGTSTVIRPPG